MHLKSTIYMVISVPMNQTKRHPLTPILTLLLACPVIASAQGIAQDDPLSVFIKSYTQEVSADFGETTIMPLSGTIVPSDIALTSSPQPQSLPQIKDAQEIRSEVVVTAMGYLDRPYVYGGDAMNQGFDCSGFVLSLYKRALNLELPRTAAEQAKATQRISRSDLTPGDLVFFNTTRRKYSHVGIYVGDGRFIHSPRTGAKIRIESMESNYWRKRFNGAHRVALNG